METRFKYNLKAIEEVSKDIINFKKLKKTKILSIINNTSFEKKTEKYFLKCFISSVVVTFAARKKPCQF